MGGISDVAKYNFFFKFVILIAYMKKNVGYRFSKAIYILTRANILKFLNEVFDKKLYL